MESFHRPASSEVSGLPLQRREAPVHPPALPPAAANQPPQNTQNRNYRPILTSERWIEAWNPHWHNGYLFLNHPPNCLSKYPTELMPPRYFFNNTSTYDPRLEIFFSQFNGLTFLYTVHDNHGVLAFKVTPQAPQPVGGGIATPIEPDQVLGKRIFRDEQNGSQQPKKKARKNSPTKMSGPPRIRKDRTVQTRLCMDIWKRVFDFSDPGMLFTFRQVSKTFRNALQYSHIWRNSMKDYFGEDLPATPLPLKDSQYADLLAGQGCQSCGDAKARKTYWAFLRRWCTGCLDKKILKQDDVATIGMTYRGLLQCIPCATVDSWNHYSYAGYGNGPGRQASSGHQPVFLKDDVTRVLQDYQEFLQFLDKRAIPDEEKIALQQAWMKECREQTDLYMDHRFEIDAWEKQWNTARAAKSIELKIKREKFIIKKAAEMQPPLREEVLELIPAYQDNIKINKDFKSDKLWQVLRPKLEQVRERAERIWAKEKQAEQTNYWDQMRLLQTLPPSRGLEMVSQLTEQAIEKYELVRMQGQSYDLTHQEFTLGVLGEIWTLWNQLHPGQKPQSQFPTDSPFRESYPRDGRYFLTIEHACRIVENQITRKLAELYPEFRQPTRNTQKFRCPGCKRNDSNKRRTFRDLMNHIRDDHANTVGDFDLFRLAGPRPDVRWLCAVPWPRNLPVVLDSQKSPGSWDLNATPHDYSSPRANVSNQPNPNAEPSAFAQRRATFIVTPLSDGPDDFIGTLRFALHQLSTTSLDVKIRSKIALEYGLQLWDLAYPNNTTPPDFQLLRSDLETLLVSTNNHDIFNKLCCRACQISGEGRTRGGKNFAKMPSTRNQLIAHFQRDHQSSMKSWPNELFALPSQQEVNVALRKATDERTHEVFDELFPVADDYVFRRND